MAKFRSHPQPTVHISGPKRKSQMSALRIVGGDKSSRAVWLRCRGAYRQEQQQQTTAFDHVSIPCCNNPCLAQSAQTISDTGKGMALGAVFLPASEVAQAWRVFRLRKTATSALLTLPSATPTTRLVSASGSAMSAKSLNP